MTLDEHLRFNQTYGNLGIVFNDNIMKLIELNPVRYVSRYSIVAKRISEFEEFKSHLTMSDKGIQLHGIGGISDVQFKSFLTSEGIGFKYNTVRTWMENLAYSKSFVAELERKDKSTGKYQVSAPYYYFGLEREWRIVPIQLFVNFDKTKERLTDVDFFKIYENINLNPYFEKIIVKSGFRGQVEELLYKFKLNHVEIILNDSYGNDS